MTTQQQRSGTKNIQRLMVGLVVGVVLVIGGLWLYHRLDATVRDYDVLVQPSVLPADGVSSALLEIRLISRFGNYLNATVLPYAPSIEIIEGTSLIRVIQLDDSLRYRLVSRFETGTVVIHVHVWGAPGPIEVKLQLTPSLADRNGNGFPDVMDLTSASDRSAFRRWFTTIALGQLTHLDDRWHDRDCAGLLRYCYREALKKHDNTWLAGRKWLAVSGIPDVRKYNYPNVPLVGTRVFNAGSRLSDEIDRTDQEHTTDAPSGVQASAVPAIDTRRPAKDTASNFQFSILNSQFFQAFAEASRLKDNSLVYLSRSIEDAEPGDVIFYLNDTDSKWPYHTMIYLGNRTIVYHTGPDGNNPGIVKRLTLDELGLHPNSRWHPVRSNPYFLGYYRWRILR